jgi:signal transduction histidine kinase
MRRRSWERPGAPQRLQWAHAIIQRQVKHMAWLLDDLLDVARITQGKLELRRAWVLVTHIVDAAMDTARPQMDDKKHQLIVQLPAVSPVLHANPCACRRSYRIY